MAYYKIKDETMTGIADAIRQKNGTSYAYSPAQMAAAIGGIQTGNAFNIAYGSTAPADTTQLWVKSAEPAAVQITSKVIAGGEALEMYVSAIPTASAQYYGAGTAVVGKKAYLFGGYSTNQMEDRLSTISVFDMENQTMEVISTTLPQTTGYIAAASVGTKIYLFGGKCGDNYAYTQNFLSTIQMFDTQNHTIQTLNVTLPTAACHIAAAAVGTNVYLFGGCKYGNTNEMSTIYVFNTESNTISTLDAKLPVAARDIGTAVVGTKVYLFGGYKDSSNTSLSTILEFDTQTCTIRTLNATIPTAASRIGTAVMGEKVYLFGGSGRLATINVFHVESNTVETLSATLPIGGGWIGIAMYGVNVYLIGGYSGDIISAIHKFVASFPLTANSLLIETSSIENMVCLLPGVELGVSNVYKGTTDGLAQKVSAAVYKNDAWVEI